MLFITAQARLAEHLIHITIVLYFGFPSPGPSHFDPTTGSFQGAGVWLHDVNGLLYCNATKRK